MRPKGLRIGVTWTVHRHPCGALLFGGTMRYTPEQISHLESRIDKRGQNDCWISHWAVDDEGYSHVRIKHTGKRVLVHRAIYEFYVGEIPNMFHLHHALTCISKACANPSHLTPIGPSHHGKLTNATRAFKPFRGDEHWMHLHPERILRGSDHWTRHHPERLARGERNGAHRQNRKGDKNGNAKVTDAQADEIRQLRKQGVLLKFIAERFGITLTQVSAIARNKSHPPR